MRLPRLFGFTLCAAAFVAAMSCAPASNNPTVMATGGLTLSGCTAGVNPGYETCSFMGSMTNNGPGCADNIHGTTTTTDSTGTVGSVSWTFDGELAVGEAALYEGSGLGENISLVNNDDATYHTTISATGVTCPSPTNPSPVGR